MSPSRDGKMAVVTGAATGIGQAVAVRLAKDGARVALLNVGDSNRTVELIAAIGGESLAFLCDVTDEGSDNAAAAATADHLGAASTIRGWVATPAQLQSLPLRSFNGGSRMSQT